MENGPIGPVLIGPIRVYGNAVNTFICRDYKKVNALFFNLYYIVFIVFFAGTMYASRPSRSSAPVVFKLLRLVCLKFYSVSVQ